MTNKRKPGQSLLDYLWVNYGNLEVSNLIGSDSPDEVILTEKAVVEEIESRLGSFGGLDEYYNKELIDELIPLIDTITDDDVKSIIEDIFDGTPTIDQISIITEEDANDIINEIFN